MEAAGRLPVDRHDTSKYLVSSVLQVSWEKGVMTGFTYNKTERNKPEMSLIILISGVCVLQFVKIFAFVLNRHIILNLDVIRLMTSIPDVY